MPRPNLRVLHGYRPHDAVVLGLDPARRTGWGLFIRGKLIGSGVATDAAERFGVLEQAVETASDEELPLVIVAEDWTPGDWKSWISIARVHEAWGRWSEQLELLGLERVVRVKVNDWRRDLYGARHVARMPKKVAKALACSRVTSMYGKNVSDDEAEGILIGEWGCRAGEVAALLAA